MVSEPDTPQRIARLTPLADVLARIDALVEPVGAARGRDSAPPLGRSLAEDVDRAAASAARRSRCATAGR